MFGKKKRKEIERVCGNCRLYDGRRAQCSVVVLVEGRREHVPMDPKDSCFFEQSYFDPKTGEQSDFNEIREVKFWVEDREGKKTDGPGTVKIEYPEEFFGGPTLEELL